MKALMVHAGWGNAEEAVEIKIRHDPTEGVPGSLAYEARCKGDANRIVDVFFDLLPWQTWDAVLETMNKRDKEQT